MAETPTASDAPQSPPPATTPGATAIAEAGAPVAKDAPVAEGGAGAPSPAPATGGAEGQALAAPAAPVAAGGEAAAPPKTLERRNSRRKSSLKKRPSKKGSVLKTDGALDEDEEEVEVPKIIYPIDAKMQETLRKAWSLFIKKGQKKKTEISELDIPTVMRSIAINPTEAQVKEIIANTRAQDVPTTSKGFLTYECFEQRIAESYQVDPNKFNRIGKERILAALHTISGGANEMNAAELKKIMMTKGDAMTEQEAALMIRHAGDRDTGNVYVEEYADVLVKDGIPQPPPDPTVW